MYNPDNGRSVCFTSTGVSIWQSLSTGKDRDGIIQALTEEFDPLPEDVLEDIKIFCDQIVRAGFAHT
ncbi:MAG: PqqD family protein [Methanospirillum hungatei]|nr:PqqD family protein [Methanospirillum hungatei]